MFEAVLGVLKGPGLHGTDKGVREKMKKKKKTFFFLGLSKLVCT